MNRAILRAYALYLSWLLKRGFICAVDAMLHGRHFFFFSRIYVYGIDEVAPGNLLFARDFVFCAIELLSKRVGIEVFWRGVDRARLWPWLLDLALFVHLLLLALLLNLHVLALLSLFFVQRLFPAADFWQPFICTLADLCLFLAPFFILSAEYDCSSRIAICIETHAWALYSGMKGLMSLFHPQILLLKFTRGNKPIFGCWLVIVDAAAIQLLQNVI